MRLAVAGRVNSKLINRTRSEIVLQLLPRDEARRRLVLGQYAGVAGGGWVAGILWLFYGYPALAVVLLLPCTVLLVFIARAYRE